MGEVVWAKMRGYPHWPGQITALKDSPFSIRKGAYCVFFFGSRNYAPIFPEDLKPFHELDANQMKVKHLQMNKAIIECENFLAGKIRIFHEHNKKELLLYDGMFSMQRETRGSGSSSPEDSTDNLSSSTKGEKETTRGPSQLLGKDNKMNGVGHEDILEKIPFVKLHQCEMLTEEQVLCLANKEVKPTEKPIGFIGLGCLGRAVVRNLLLTKHNVTVWNRNADVSREFERLGAIVGTSPKDLVNECQIIFICLPDSEAVSDLVVKEEILSVPLLEDKCFVQMSCINAVTAAELSKVINLKGGRFLMTSVIGTKAEIHVGDMVVLASGDRAANEECDSCFHAICGMLHYLGENVNTAITLGASLNYLRATSLGALSEALSLAEKIGLNQTDFVDIMDSLKLFSPYQREAASKMINGCFITQKALQHVTNDLKIIVDIAEFVGSEKMEIMSQLLQSFKIAKSIGLKDHDESSIYLKAQTPL